MKTSRFVIALCVFTLCAALCVLVVAILHNRRVNSNLGWGPEPRSVKILSVNAISGDDFYGSDIGDADHGNNEYPDRYYYRATALDVASAAHLRWKLNCAQKIDAPVTMTYTQYDAGSAPRLEIRGVTGGPYNNVQEARANAGGSVPADQETMSFNDVMGSAPQVYLLLRAPVVASNDFRSAEPIIDSNTGQREVQFELTDGAGDRFYNYTSNNIGKSMAVVLNGSIRMVAVIKSPIRDSGVIQGNFTRVEVAELSKMLRMGGPANYRSQDYGNLSGTGTSSAQNRCSIAPDHEIRFLFWTLR